MVEEIKREGRPPKTGTLDEAVVNMTNRPELREQLRPDHRDRAAQRTKELLEHLQDSDFDGTTDEFYFPTSMVPDGWTYDWKRWSVLNQEDPHYQTGLRQMGWDYVPASRHPEMMPLNSTDKFIMRKGLVLMERPAEITEMVKKRDLKKARDQVQRKEEQLTSPPPGQFNRNNKDDSLVKVRRSYSPMPIPE